LAYIVGDYISPLYQLGTYSPAIYASLVVIVLTTINIVGVKFGTGTQKILLAIQFAGLLLVAIVGFFITPSPTALAELPVAGGGTGTALGLAMVFVLLTFGGWNEAGYISAELRAGSRKMVQVLVISVLVITAIYLLINGAFLRV